MGSKMNYSAVEMEKRRNRRRVCHITAITLFCLLLITLGALLIHLHNEARHVLREAKNAQLAVKVVAIEYYALNEPIFDQRQPNGFTEAAMKDIRYYSGIEGDLFLIAADENGIDPTAMVYISENGYVATYGVQESGWVVSRSLRLSAETDVD